MSRFVVDSSVVAKWFFVEEHSTEAGLLLDSYRGGGCSIIVPDFLYAEVANILWKHHRQRNVDLRFCQAALDTLRELLLPIFPMTRLLDEAIQLAVQYDRTVYDMLYVALADREGCPFITADERLVNALSVKLPTIVWLGKWTAPTQ